MYNVRCDNNMDVSIGGTKSMPAETITVLMSGHTFLVEERECADLSHVEAPKTPPMGFFRCSPTR